MRLLHFLFLISVVAAGCDCGAGQLISTPESHPHDTASNAPVANTPAPANPPGWCGTDCDCPTGSVCLSGSGELAQNTCQAGTNTCPRPCATTCGSGTTCQNGVCVVAPCVG